jgi:hypothetical protein
MLVCVESSMNCAVTASGPFTLEAIRDDAREIDERVFSFVAVCQVQRR